MDEIELLVSETFKHFHENFSHVEVEEEEKVVEMKAEDPLEELPACAGLLYHIQKSVSIFVIRTLVSQNIREDYRAIIERPEDYPSLRLLEGNTEVTSKLRFFMVEDASQAEIIHDQLCNRRFPIDEEIMCNISDPGFSWWLTKKNQGFQLAFTLSVGQSQQTVKLGPLGDQQMAIRRFQEFAHMLVEAGIPLDLQNEVNRVQFTEDDEFLLEELKDLFEFGVVTEGLSGLFKILARQTKDLSKLETMWFYIQEVAAMRRFWIQVQYDLNS